MNIKQLLKIDVKIFTWDILIEIKIYLCIKSLQVGSFSYTDSCNYKTKFFINAIKQ